LRAIGRWYCSPSFATSRRWGFLAFAVVYMLGYSATYAYVAVLVLAVATVALAAAVVIFVADQVSGPLIAVDGTFVVLCIVSELLLLVLDPNKPVGPDVLLIPAVLGSLAGLGGRAAVLYRRRWQTNRL